jgi:hypothetical protein
VIEQFRECPIHNEATQLLHQSDPDDDWQANFERLSKQAKSATDIQRTIPLIHDVEVIEEHGVLFVSQPALQQAGVRFSTMQPDQFYLFELEDGWIYETQGFHDGGRRWWVERVMEVEPAPFQVFFIADTSSDDDWEWEQPR